ncbi:hypothetical protein ACYZT3_20815 [Pseudomonas sp. MDT1-16]
MKSLSNVLGKKSAALLLLALSQGLLTASIHAATGPNVARDLNYDYQLAINKCAEKPAYVCSGVLARASPATGEFWKHGEVPAQLGAESFIYLRADLGTRILTHANGMLFSRSAAAKEDLLCAYPFELTLPGSRPDFGCGWLAAAANAAADPSSCAAQGVSDAPGWLVHFQKQNLQLAAQCSLSSVDPASFKASLQAHQGLDASWSARPMQVQVKNWDATAPKQMPIIALFYDVKKTGALLGAQKDQRDYFIATGDWLPVLRMDLSLAPGAVFGFDQQDQMYVGYQVASRLNSRYADTAMACRGNTAAYYCNGVLIRTTDASPDFHAWNSSPGSIQRNGVSFSYLRADIHLPVLAWGKNQGLIMKELAAPTAYPLTLRCSFPFDGATFYRSDSCNAHSDAPTASRPCDEQGISSAASVVQHLYAQSSRYNGCSLKGDQAPFAVSIEARAALNENDQKVHNEVIIANWPQNIAKQLPLEAFFYVAATGLPNAQFFQKDYFQQTGRYLPVIHLRPHSSGSGYMFSFDPNDQSVQVL